MTDFAEKKLIFFDMDGTLALSKAPIDNEMKELLTSLLAKKKVVVISGGGWPQFEKQLVNILDLPNNLKENLFIATGSGSSLHYFENGEHKTFYEKLMSPEEKTKVRNALAQALKETDFDESLPMYGERLEDRGGAMVFSALGQQAPFEIKSKWDPDHKNREKIVAILKPLLPEFEVRIGGTNTIDITQKGIDKTYGIKQTSERLGIPISEMLYIGDALFPGGNDEPAKASGVDTLQVADVEETKKVINEIMRA